VSTQRLHWDGDLRFTGTDSWGNPVAIDGDRTSATGAKPSDLLPISLAACTAYDIVTILRKQRQPITGLETEVTSTQAADAPWRFERISVRYTVHGDVDPAKARRALELSETGSCSISATLRDSVVLDFSIVVAH
jgi:putative redox protein